MESEHRKEEERLRDKLSEFLVSKGYETFIEVIPDQCINWKNPYRVDLIFHGNGIDYIGVECKHINTLRSGGQVANAYKQIQTRIDKTFFGGKKVSRWAICLFYSNYDPDAHCWTVLETFITTFLNAMGISILYFDMKRRNSRIIIDPWTKSSLHIADYSNGDNTEFLS
jgi:hypothetical protein